jgi:hypothetical protein
VDLCGKLDVADSIHTAEKLLTNVKSIPAVTLVYKKEQYPKGKVKKKKNYFDSTCH